MMTLKLTALQLLLLISIKFGFIDAIPSDGYTKPVSYKFHSDGTHWHAAKNKCKSEGARLFHPDSAEELDLVLKQLAGPINNLNSSFVEIHLGFSDTKKYQEYKTVDGRPISQVYNKWEIGHPDSLNGRWRCGHLALTNRQLPNRLISLSFCESSRLFICKLE